VLLRLRPAVISFNRRELANLKAEVRVSENCFSANRIFILFNHAVLTGAIVRKLASEKRRPNVPIFRAAADDA